MKLTAKAYLRIAAKKPIKNWRNKYDWIGDFDRRIGLARVGLNDKMGLIDKTGKEVVKPKYDDVWFFHKGLAKVKLEGKWGFIDKTGKEVIPLKYNDVWFFHDGLAGVKLGDKYGFIDKQDNIVIPLKYDSVYSFHGGLAKVELDGQWGFVDETGKEVIPCVYEEEELPKRKDIPALSLKIRKSYEKEPEGLELIRPEFDWKAWYEQVIK